MLLIQLEISSKKLLQSKSEQYISEIFDSDIDWNSIIDNDELDLFLYSEDIWYLAGEIWEFFIVLFSEFIDFEFIDIWYKEDLGEFDNSWQNDFDIIFNWLLFSFFISILFKLSNFLIFSFKKLLVSSNFWKSISYFSKWFI